MGRQGGRRRGAPRPVDGARTWRQGLAGRPCDPGTRCRRARSRGSARRERQRRMQQGDAGAHDSPNPVRGAPRSTGRAVKPWQTQRRARGLRARRQRQLPPKLLPDGLKSGRSRRHGIARRSAKPHVRGTIQPSITVDVNPSERSSSLTLRTEGKRVGVATSSGSQSRSRLRTSAMRSTSRGRPYGPITWTASLSSRKDPPPSMTEWPTAAHPTRALLRIVSLGTVQMACVAAMNGEVLGGRAAQSDPNRSGVCGPFVARSCSALVDRTRCSARNLRTASVVS
jgi:hypothetical protein